MKSEPVYQRSLMRAEARERQHRSLSKQSSKTPEAFQAQNDFRELVTQVVEVVAAFPSVAGVRFWHLLGGDPTVSREAGELPMTDKIIIERASLEHSPTELAGSRWIYPLRSNGETLGVLEVCSTGRPGENIQYLLEKFARVTEAALDRAGQQQAARELSAILEATKLLNSTLDLSKLINIILQLATRLTGADRGTVFLLDREHGEIWSLVGLGLEEHEIRRPIDHGIAGWVARHGEPVRLVDAYADPRFDPTVDRDLGYDTHLLLALPIRNKDGEIVGVLELLNKEEGSFDAADQDALSYISEHVALALDNARLHRELLAKERMESDLLLAHSVQRGLLPECPPKLDGLEISVAYAPSHMVGGDYYDFVPLGPGTWLTVIADVEGKGVASALVMANLQATLRTLAAHVHSLEKIVESVNDLIQADTQTRKLLSIFAGVLDHRKGALHYVNAGHVPPAVIRANGGIEKLSEGGILVGVLPRATYTRGYVQLQRGDIVVGYTDGITEAMDAHGNQYGLERLLNVVHRECDARAEQIVQTVLAEVNCFSRGASHEDDRVVLIVKVS